MVLMGWLGVYKDTLEQTGWGLCENAHMCVLNSWHAPISTVAVVIISCQSGKFT